MHLGSVLYLRVVFQFPSRCTLYGALHNHVVIDSLLLNFNIVALNITFHLIFIRRGAILPSTSGACFLWQYLDYGF